MKPLTDKQARWLTGIVMGRIGLHCPKVVESYLNEIGTGIWELTERSQREKVFVELSEFKIGAYLIDKTNPFYQEGDEDAPFFSEAFLYNLFQNKDDARSLLGLIRRLKELVKVEEI